MDRYEVSKNLDKTFLFFDSKPSDKIPSKIKASGWRWYPERKCWYTTYSEESLALAKELTNKSSVYTDSISSPKSKQNYCYANTLENFLKISELDWICKMESGFGKAYTLELSPEQIVAWRDCFQVLHFLPS